MESIPRHCTTQLLALRPDMTQREGTPGVLLPFEVYSQAPLRLILMVQLRALKDSQNTRARIS